MMAVENHETEVAFWRLVRNITKVLNPNRYVGHIPSITLMEREDLVMVLQSSDYMAIEDTAMKYSRLYYWNYQAYQAWYLGTPYKRKSLDNRSPGFKTERLEPVFS